MKCNYKKIIFVFFMMILTLVMSCSVYAHSGRTDSSGGHKDNKNKSGLGYYHYHCGGNPPHLHQNGVCPYSSSKTSSSSESESKTAQTVSTIEVTEVRINQQVDSLIVGENKILTATVLPSNSTNKSVKWSSSNEYIATISSTGVITAKNAGKVLITATAANGIKSTLNVEVKEEKKVENTAVIKTTVSQNNNIINDTTYDQEATSGVGGVLTLALLGGGYFGYKKYKKTKNS